MKVIKDLYEANIRDVICDLNIRMTHMQALRANATRGGEYEATLSEMISAMHELIHEGEKLRDKFK